MAPLADPVPDGSAIGLARDAPTIVERLDAPETFAAVRETHLPVGVYRLTDATGVRLLAVGPDPAEHGSAFAGESAPTALAAPEPAPADRPYTALVAILVLAAELFVAPL
jgi:hypothetical protein